METKEESLEEQRERYHDAMAGDMAHFVLGHFQDVKRYVPYGFHKHCKDVIRPIVDKLMDHEGELNKQENEEK